MSVETWFDARQALARIRARRAQAGLSPPQRVANTQDLSPVSPGPATDPDTLIEDEEEAIEERAAILEHDAGMPRTTAERVARDQVAAARGSQTQRPLPERRDLPHPGDFA